MNLASRPTMQLPREHRATLVLEELSSVTHALACLAGVHSWTPLDPRVHGQSSGCTRCGEVKVGTPGPLDHTPRIVR
jgi:hypothetical protein